MVGALEAELARLLVRAIFAAATRKLFRSFLDKATGAAAGAGAVVEVDPTG